MTVVWLVGVVCFMAGAAFVLAASAVESRRSRVVRSRDIDDILRRHR